MGLLLLFPSHLGVSSFKYKQFTTVSSVLIIVELPNDVTIFSSRVFFILLIGVKVWVRVRVSAKRAGKYVASEIVKT